MDIQVQHIDFSHGDTAVISQLSCCFAPGKFHGIVGPNGSGKTTLIDLIAGFHKPSSGQILLGDRPLQSWTATERARQLTRISQNETIGFPFTVEEVVLMGRHPHIPRFTAPSHRDWRRVEQAMEQAGVTEFKHRAITELSGGEQQRCLFARALCQDTPLLLLDEAFSNMDIHHTLAMLSQLRKMVAHQGKTIIAVLHDLNMAAAHCDDLFFLKKGKIQAQGPTDVVLTAEQLEQTFNIETQIRRNSYVQAKQIDFKPL
ncbi:MAG: ABC transporter ATP-binding protein [Desulfobacterales bacterium]|nr:ABC transporter ATP-binding protein [Desulfobacterales bacterium]